ncbi:MAG: ribonuclease III [Verrucomicrobia bacterium]|nr:ribonuclease III [Verrucomicrobiota bacterium]
MSAFEPLQSRLDYAFRDASLLELALTHPSVAHDPPGTRPHNQRLEFLGDAVLSLILTRELFDKFPGFGEGPLTKARAQLVNRRALAAQARQLGLGEHLVLSRGEEVHGGRSRASALADAFEALIGALFLDGGYEAARLFILRRFGDVFGELTELPSLDNPKGELQELLQAESVESPQYTLTSVTGPDHDREFECAVSHHGVELGRGRGKSKKEAESRAAFGALRSLLPKEKPPPPA